MLCGVMVSTRDSKSLGLSSNLSKATNFLSMKQTKKDKVVILKLAMKYLLADLLKIDATIDELELNNEQFVLDFYDKINEVSVRK